MELTFVVPGDVETPTGGNVYDRRLRDGLLEAGTQVAWRPLDGSWPTPAAADAAALDRLLASAPEGSTVLLDGIVACGVPEVVLPHAQRLRLAVVVHMPLARETGVAAGEAARLASCEREVLGGVPVVLVTSRWTAAAVTSDVPGATPLLAPPGTDPAPQQTPRPDGTHLLCLGSVMPRKGQRVLLAALDGLAGGWDARFVGQHRDPLETMALLGERAAAGLGRRVALYGPATGTELDEHWRWADVLVVPSHVETFGMVATEALARGMPVVATSGSALPEALGSTPEGPPGLFAAPGDPVSLRHALTTWLTDAELRTELTRRAGVRGAELSRWQDTAAAVAQALR